MNTWIKDFRIEKTGLSQSKFAKFFGIEIDTLQNWEQGRSKTPEYVQRMLSMIHEYRKMMVVSSSGDDDEYINNWSFADDPQD